MKKCNWLYKSLFITLCTTVVFTGGCGTRDKAPEDKKLKIGMVTDMPNGLQDQSFNQATYEGCLACKKQFGADIKALESEREDKYVPNLTQLAREGRGLIWASGFKLENAVAEVAPQFPKANFALIDSNFGGKANIPNNAVAVTFKEEEAAFLAGVAAALTTKTNKVGGIGGIESPLIRKFECGFKQGVEAVNPKCEVTWIWAGSFTDSAEGRAIAKTLYNSGTDVIFHAAGGVGKGMFSEVATRKVGECWAIGCDIDQAYLAPNHTLTSLLKYVNNAVVQVTKQFKDGKFPSKEEVEFGLKENAVGIVDSKWLKPDVKKKIEEYKKKIINGEIVVKTENSASR